MVSRAAHVPGHAVSELHTDVCAFFAASPSSCSPYDPPPPQINPNIGAKRDNYCYVLDHWIFPPTAACVA